jgi:dihydroxyacid dehydratase/phosphogluconate dehydratase
VSSLSRANCRILKGNLAPGGAVAKITGKEGLGFTGKARVFDTEAAFFQAVETGSIKKGEKTVVILRYLGPKGGPGSLHLFHSNFLVIGQKMSSITFYMYFINLPAFPFARCHATPLTHPFGIF